jgi:hypothetical protein
MRLPTRSPDAPRPRRAARLAAATAAALLLAACGGDDADDAETDVAAEVDDDAADDATDPTEDEVADDDTSDDEVSDAEPDDADTAAEGTEDEAPADVDPAPSGGTLDGELVVAGTAYEPREALVCEDDGAFPMDVELEYQAFADGPDGPGQLDVFISELGADASWSGEEGIYGDGLSNSDITFTGDRVSGTATVVDAMGSEETLEISFDLEVPSTTFACRG